MFIFLVELKKTTNSLCFVDWKSRRRTTWSEKKNSPNGPRKRKKNCSLRYSQLFQILENELSGSEIFCMLWNIMLKILLLYYCDSDTGLINENDMAWWRVWVSLGSVLNLKPIKKEKQ